VLNDGRRRFFNELASYLCADVTHTKPIHARNVKIVRGRELPSKHESTDVLVAKRERSHERSQDLPQTECVQCQELG
jgi:hypothetical protein